MQTEEETLPVASMASKESIYRTRWLMAHNRLHAAVHENSRCPTCGTTTSRSWSRPRK